MPGCAGHALACAGTYVHASAYMHARVLVHVTPVQATCELRACDHQAEVSLLTQKIARLQDAHPAQLGPLFEMYERDMARAAATNQASRRREGCLRQAFPVAPCNWLCVLQKAILPSSRSCKPLYGLMSWPRRLPGIRKSIHPRGEPAWETRLLSGALVKCLSIHGPGCAAKQCVVHLQSLLMQCITCTLVEKSGHSLCIASCVRVVAHHV